MSVVRSENLSAFEALSQAQRITCLPFIFQTAVCLKRMGFLNYLDEKGKNGASLEDITTSLGVQPYVAVVLLNCGEAFGLVRKVEEKFYLSKVGYFLENDPMVEINLNFSQDVCYLGLSELQKSLETGKPEGLKFLGDWETIYPALQVLPGRARKSWFDFDHFYSDHAYSACLKYVFEKETKTICDIGGNTGKFALLCCQHSPSVNLHIVDLPRQCQTISLKAKEAGFSERITVNPTDVLQIDELPVQRADVYEPIS